MGKNQKHRNLTVTRVVGVFDLTAVIAHGRSLELRVEISNLAGRPSRYRARVFRKEFFRLQPTFPQRRGVPRHSLCDEAFFVEDEGFLASNSEVKARTPTGALRKVTACITKRLVGVNRMTR